MNKDDLTERIFDMFNHIRQNGQIKVLDERKDARKKLNEFQPVVATCKTKYCEFKVLIESTYIWENYLNMPIILVCIMLVLYKAFCST